MEIRVDVNTAELSVSQYDAAYARSKALVEKDYSENTNLSNFKNQYLNGDILQIKSRSNTDIMIAFGDNDSWSDPTVGYRIRLNDEGKLEVFRTSKIYIEDRGSETELDQTFDALRNLRPSEVQRVTSTDSIQRILSIFSKSDAEFNGANNFRNALENIFVGHRESLAKDILEAKTDQERDVAAAALARFTHTYGDTTWYKGLDVFIRDGDYKNRDGYTSTLDSRVFASVDSSEATVANFADQLQELEDDFRIYFDALDEDEWYTLDYKKIQELRETKLKEMVDELDLGDDIKVQAKNKLLSYVEVSDWKDDKKLLSKDEIEEFMQYLLQLQLKDANKANAFNTAGLVNLGEDIAGATLPMFSAAGPTTFVKFISTPIDTTPTEVADDDKKKTILDTMKIVFPESFASGDETDIEKNTIYQGKSKDGSQYTLVVTTHDGVDAGDAGYSVYGVMINPDTGAFKKIKQNLTEVPDVKATVDSLISDSRENEGTAAAVDAATKKVETIQAEINEILNSPRLASVSMDDQKIALENLTEKRVNALGDTIATIFESARRDDVLHGDIPKADIKADIKEQITVALKKAGLEDAQITALDEDITKLVNSYDEANVSKRMTDVKTKLNSLILNSGLSIAPEIKIEEVPETLKVLADLADGESGAASPYAQELIRDITLQIARKQEPSHRILRKLRNYLESIDKLPESYDADIKELVASAKADANPLFLSVLNYDPALKEQMSKLNDIIAGLGDDKIDLNMTEFYSLFQSNGIPKSVYNKNKAIVDQLNTAGITNEDDQKQALFQLFSLKQADASVDPGFATGIPSTISDDIESPENFNMKAFREKLASDEDFKTAYLAHLQNLSIAGDQDMLARYGVFHSLMMDDTYGTSLDFISSADTRYENSLLEYADKNIQYYQNYKAFTDANHQVQYGINPETVSSIVDNAGISYDAATKTYKIDKVEDLAKLGQMFGLILDDQFDVETIFPTDEDGKLSDSAKAFVDKFDAYGKGYNANMSKEELIDRLFAFGYLGRDGKFDAEGFAADLNSRTNQFLTKTYPRAIENPESFNGRADSQRAVFANLKKIFGGEENLRNNAPAQRQLISEEEYAKSLSSYVNFLANFQENYKKEIEAPKPPVAPATSFNIPSSQPQYVLDSNSRALDILLDGQKQDVFGDRYSWAA